MNVMEESKIPIVIYGCDSDLAEEVKEWMKIHAGGDWRKGMRMLLDLAEMKPILSSLFQRVTEVEERLNAHLKEHEPIEEQEDEGVKTFGGLIK